MPKETTEWDRNLLRECRGLLATLHLWGSRAYQKRQDVKWALVLSERYESTDCHLMNWFRLIAQNLYAPNLALSKYKTTSIFWIEFCEDSSKDCFELSTGKLSRKPCTCHHAFPIKWHVGGYLARRNLLKDPFIARTFKIEYRVFALLCNQEWSVIDIPISL